MGHTNTVTSVAISPYGKYIVSGGDGTVRLWDLSSGKEIAQIIGFSDGEWVVVTSEGYYTTSPNGDKALNVSIGTSVYGI